MTTIPANGIVLGSAGAGAGDGGRANSSLIPTNNTNIIDEFTYSNMPSAGSSSISTSGSTFNDINSQHQLQLPPQQQHPLSNSFSYSSSPYSSSRYTPSLSLPYGVGYNNSANLYGNHNSFLNGGLGVNPYNSSMYNPHSSPNLGMFNHLTNLPDTAMHYMSNSIASFGRISQLLQLNFDSVHMTFTSLLRLIENACLIQMEITPISNISNYTVIRLLKHCIIKLKHLLYNIVGKKTNIDEISEIWTDNNTSESLNGGKGDKKISPPNDSSDNKYFDWCTECIPVIILVAMIWAIVKWVWRKFQSSSSSMVDQSENIAKYLSSNHYRTGNSPMSYSLNHSINPNLSSNVDSNQLGVYPGSYYY